MKNRKFGVAMVLIIAAAGWIGVRSFRCKRRGEAFSRQVQAIRTDAHEQLGIGAKPDDIARFFEKHGIPFVTYEQRAQGQLSTTGCAPFGCGTDRASLFVSVKLDDARAVKEEPRVFGMYHDCL